ncbi:hypothetical protein GCM10023147_02730 [Tsukamurella soli]|uniref:Secreted protein n=1 Tax=Tsukamurella soli TaxID=644556 RepID=A0ABP8J1W4_9ACTN
MVKSLALNTCGFAVVVSAPASGVVVLVVTAAPGLADDVPPLAARSKQDAESGENQCDNDLELHFLLDSKN